jgi:hypothetical protein
METTGGTGAKEPPPTSALKDAKTGLSFKSVQHMVPSNFKKRERRPSSFGGVRSEMQTFQAVASMAAGGRRVHAPRRSSLSKVAENMDIFDALDLP